MFDVNDYLNVNPGTFAHRGVCVSACLPGNTQAQVQSEQSEQQQQQIRAARRSLEAGHR